MRENVIYFKIKKAVFGIRNSELVEYHDLNIEFWF